MTITLQKIENKYKREGDPGNEKSVAGMVRIGADPIPFETDGPKQGTSRTAGTEKNGKTLCCFKADRRTSMARSNEKSLLWRC
jgi:hypothetical protein